MTERGPETLPTTSLGHYKVRAKIGSGGMGDVFDAVHTGLNKRVAIKTLRKRYLDDEIVVARFLREGQLASRIRHPNIVDVTDVGMMGGLPCLVMEHLEGESLSAMIRRERRLPADTLVDFLLPIVAAVDFAHDHGIVHRDLKPSNIFLSRSWNGEIVPKVLDFGISKLVHDSQQAALTTDEAFVGTPHYASPELMRADKVTDGRSDQYSMGVILYEASTGVRPFANLGNNFVALAMAICKGEYAQARERNPDVPVALERVIQRAMALHAQDRFLSMRALGEALLPFASSRAQMIWAPTFCSNGEPFEPRSVALAPPSNTTVANRSPFPEPPRVLAPRLPPRVPGPPTSGPYTPTSEPPVEVVQGTPLMVPRPSLIPSTTPPGAMLDPRVPSAPSYAQVAMEPSPPRRRGVGAISVMVGLLLAVVLVASIVVLRTARRSEPLVAPAASASTFDLEIRVTPSNAAIELDGVPVGAGHIQKTIPRDGRTHALRLSAAGYETLLIEFDHVRPPPSDVVLRALAPTASPVRAPTTPTGTSGHSGTSRSTSSGGTPSGTKTKGNSEARPKTDNIDPWE